MARDLRRLQQGRGVRVPVADRRAPPGGPLTLGVLGFLCAAAVLNSCHASTKDVGTPDTADASADSDEPRCIGSGAWAAVSAGPHGTCGVHGDGCIECWTARDTGPVTPGVNDTGYYGPMGDLVPPVGGSYSTVDLAHCADWGTHTCAIRRSDGGIDCWGSDAWRENSPPDGEFTSLSLGKHDSCALGTDGRIACWGREIGAGDVARYTVGADYVAVSNCGGVCGLALDGHVDCWSLGSESWLHTHDGPWTAIANSGYEVIGVTPEGLVSSTTTSLTLPQPKAGAVDVCLTWFGGCVLDVEGHVVCEGEESPSPEETFAALACGEFHVCGVTTDGRIVCWGSCGGGACDVPEHE